MCRFNLMNNWRRYQEKVDIWVARYSSEASQRYWGFTNFRKPDAEHVVDSLQVKRTCPACAKQVMKVAWSSQVAV